MPGRDRRKPCNISKFHDPRTVAPLQPASPLPSAFRMRGPDLGGAPPTSGALRQRLKGAFTTVGHRSFDQICPRLDRSDPGPEGLNDLSGGQGPLEGIGREQPASGWGHGSSPPSEYPFGRAGGVDPATLVDPRST